MLDALRAFGTVLALVAGVVVLGLPAGVREVVCAGTFFCVLPVAVLGVVFVVAGLLAVGEAADRGSLPVRCRGGR